MADAPLKPLASVIPVVVLALDANVPSASAVEDVCPGNDSRFPPIVTFDMFKPMTLEACLRDERVIVVLPRLRPSMAAAFPVVVFVVAMGCALGWVERLMNPSPRGDCCGFLSNLCLEKKASSWRIL